MSSESKQGKPTHDRLFSPLLRGTLPAVAMAFLAMCDGTSIHVSSLLSQSAFSQQEPTTKTDGNANEDSTKEPLSADDPQSAQMAGDLIHPDYSKSLLTIGSRSISPHRIRERWPSEYLIGNSLIRIRRASVESVNHETGEVAWRNHSERDWSLRWLGHHNNVLFFTDKTPLELNHQEAPEAMTKVLRMSLQSGAWLKPFELPLNAEERKGLNRVTDLIAADDAILVLNDTFGTNKFVGYRLTRFSADSSEVIWSNFYRSAGTLPSPTAALFGSRGPANDDMAIQKLTRIGNEIVLCAGPLEDLVGIAPASGETTWRIPRLWEFRRGFIGPSVWSYFLARYGVQDHDLALSEMSLEQLRERSKKDDGFFADENYVKQLKRDVKAGPARTNFVCP